MRHTVSPLIGGILAPAAVRKLFAPSPVTGRFAAEFPLDLALRPSQIRASAEETAVMNAAAERMAGRYAAIACPVAIVAGEGDRIVNTARQSLRLHRLIGGSRLLVLEDVGHMVHHVACERIVEEVEALERRGEGRRTAAPVAA